MRATPFYSIPFRGQPRTEAPRDRRSFVELCGRLEFEFEVRSAYLYVGSGQLLVRPGPLQEPYWAFARRAGELVIPGTGLKGAVRAVVEAISNSCVPHAAKNERHRLERTPHERCAARQDGRPDAGNRKRRELPPRLCPACRIFGTTGYRGRVHFSDARPIGPVQREIIKIADLWPPEPLDGRKFYRAGNFRPPRHPRPERNHRFVEAVPRGARFVSSLHFENTAPAELSLVLRGLGLDRASDPPGFRAAFAIKIGGAKPRCLGAVAVRPRALFLIPTRGPDLLLALSRGGDPHPVDALLGQWLADRSLLDEEIWKEFLKEAADSAGECPAGMY